jgi:hypothetical protein
MEFDPFDLYVKDLATRNMVTMCNCSGPMYTFRLPATRPQASTYYALTTATTPTSL